MNDCDLPYITGCTPPATITTTTVPRDIPTVGSDTSTTIGFAGALIVVGVLIVAITRTRKDPT